MAKLIDLEKKVYSIGIDSIIIWIPLIVKNTNMGRFYFQWTKSFWSDSLKDEYPWMPFEAVDWLNSILEKNMTGFEWGSGGSTLFLSNRIKNLISVEHDQEWYSLISKILKERKIDNCKYELIKPEPTHLKDFDNVQHYLSSVKEGYNFENYCKVIELYPDNYFNIVIIDGFSRSSCIYHSHKKVKLDGYLLLDDYEESYKKIISLLEGWERKEFFGPKPYTRGLHMTIVWQKKIKK